MEVKRAGIYQLRNQPHQEFQYHSRAYLYNQDLPMRWSLCYKIEFDRRRSLLNPDHLQPTLELNSTPPVIVSNKILPYILNSTNYFLISLIFVLKILLNHFYQFRSDFI
ncbi:MAG: hypothetical protein BWY04_01036 [candidate division CPR1 bacterium ADurb.Bin160]|uniref:Uncharacterized protein n=1 Tax=candidate division CPR1 bacterium ADurb.Bin160 TaxID=1852826 RepID=A0A1V5ZLL3_9BACT|nr:MAG: hypothetical protein BWY04_01036 [candidate division CPR1 bacterium ADurb.Bin160]